MHCWELTSTHLKLAIGSRPKKFRLSVVTKEIGIHQIRTCFTSWCHGDIGPYKTRGLIRLVSHWRLTQERLAESFIKIGTKNHLIFSDI